MRVDTNFYGTVPMPDAGDPSVHPKERRYGNADYIACYENMLHWAQTADGLGFDTMWLTEHHFQYEGYEVVPNLVQFGLHLAGQTRRLRLGQMFNVVPQWHPLRLAEDFATADILTGGRMEFGVGRGTVPREAMTLGSVVASGDNEMSRNANEVNWEIFEEAMEVIRLAWTRERFSFSGKHFVFPPPGIPDRGSTVTELTLVPRPTREVPVYQPISPGRTAEYCARHGHRAVTALGTPAVTKWLWDMYADFAQQHRGVTLAPGQDRCHNIHIHVGRTREEAVRTGRDGHDEFCRFLAPYGRFIGYGQPGGPLPAFDHQPTLEESMDKQVMAIGSVEDVVETLGSFRETLGMEHVVLFPDLPGLTRDQLDEQLHLIAEEVLPRLGITLPRAP
jgi:alkanesulfonate monooxygenase SsuD/methylene tetrahydromethanopterin reductase-like flavin-dependent oxidoreductase (luciferase family)